MLDLQEWMRQRRPVAIGLLGQTPPQWEAMLNTLSVADIEAVIEGALYREARRDDRAAIMAAHLVTAAGSHPKDRPDEPITAEHLLGRPLLPFDPRMPMMTAAAESEVDEEAETAVSLASAMVARAQAKAALKRKGQG